MTGARRYAWPRLWDAATLPHKENYLVVERVFTTQGDARDLTLRRPSYKTFRNIAAKVSVLMEAEPETMFGTELFEQVLQACTVENIDSWLDECDYTEAAALWDAILEFCEFPAFFAERQRQYSEASKAKALMEVDRQAAEIKRMKDTGLLPPDYSFSSVMSTGFPENLMTSPSSPTITPVDTAGPETKSKTKTTGSSSGTTRSQSAAGKRKSD